MSRRVITTEDADAQIRTIDDWWRSNRPAAPELFVEELAQCFVLLARAPEIGKRYRRHPTQPDVHRILLRATRYHVFYLLRSEMVVVLAVWHAHRGQAPPL